MWEQVDADLLLGPGAFVYPAIAVRRGLLAAYAHGMLGSAWRVAYCARDCLCRDLAEAEACAASLPCLGLRSDVASPAPRALRRPLGRGVPAPWFADGGHGVLWAAARDAEPLCAARDLHGRRMPARALPACLRAARLYVVRRSPGPAGLRSRREALALAWAAAWMQSGPTVVQRAPGTGHARSGVGLAAYEQWAADLERAAPGERFRLAEKVRAEWWLQARRAGAEFLRGLAGRKRSPLAVRLRRAAYWAEREVEEGLEPLYEHMAGARAGGAGAAVGRLRRAAALADTAATCLAEAALMGLGLPPSAQAALLGSLEEPPSGTALHEVIYLARAGIEPLRVLAARCLGGASGDAARSTLEQLLYGPSAAASDTAAAALLRAGSGGERAIARYADWLHARARASGDASSPR